MPESSINEASPTLPPAQAAQISIQDLINKFETITGNRKSMKVKSFSAAAAKKSRGLLSEMSANPITEFETYEVESMLKREEILLQFSSHFDERSGFPLTPEEDRVHWREFNVNIYSDEPSPDQAIEDLAQYSEEWFDLRPYMIEHPPKISRFAKINVAYDMFRTYHLRHLLVIDPLDDQLAGMITRKDLDAFMNFDYDADMRKFNPLKAFLP